ncbi:PD-(D/E)XK motif protein [Sandarakinorhabdus oryzae]|uniref:PD-(D/E)XK motif protein n=1 Tax=Sandarakinorhabdus oryzae TaxID=2675220 RepID=UPI0018CC04FC|nr:PD-(D/E)XK motif protein [Sandarakinorhabdus oryzae]
MTDDPWSSIAKPSEAAAVSGRRVSPDNRWDFFWAKDSRGKCLLVLQHHASSSSFEKLPKPKGLTVEIVDAVEGRKTLMLRLLDTQQRDIFLKLSEDIILAAEGAETEAEAVAVALARTWRWHHLLKGGAGGKLGEEEQKGLIGELLVLKRYLLPIFNPITAVSAWLGPIGSPKDFEIGRVAIEAKARRGTATPFVKISSEHQLDEVGCDVLFLHVVELDRLPVEADPDLALSLTSLADQIRVSLQAADQTAVEAFEACLISAGVRPEDDYSDDLWIEGRSRVFEVKDGFPRVTAQSAGAGVRGVQYSIDLAACEPFAVLSTTISEQLGKLTNVADH